MDDQAIIDLYWARDQLAIAETEKQYGRYCYTIAFNILADHEDASECLNDTWFKVWQVIPPARPTRFSIWLARIIRNLSLQKLQARNAQKRGGSQADIAIHELEECLADTDSPAGNVEAGELAAAISAYLMTIPQESRLVFIGRYFYFHNIRELSAHMGFRENKVHTLLFRTRQGLKSYLQERGYS